MDTGIGRVRMGLVGLGVVAALALAGCGSDGSDGTPSTAAGSAGSRSYVGTVQGTAAFVGVVVDGSRVLAYVCDGTPGDPQGTAPSIQAWFNGPSDGDAVDVRQAAGRLMVQLTGSAMAGTLTLADGRTLPVSGTPVQGDAGLYRAEASGSAGRGVAGWILAADGQQRGGFGGDGISLTGVRTLNLAQPTFTAQGLASARIAKVGITPIPIP